MWYTKTWDVIFRIILKSHLGISISILKSGAQKLGEQFHTIYVEITSTDTYELKNVMQVLVKMMHSRLVMSRGPCRGLLDVLEVQEGVADLPVVEISCHNNIGVCEFLLQK